MSSPTGMLASKGRSDHEDSIQVAPILARLELRRFCMGFCSKTERTSPQISLPFRHSMA